MHLIKDNNHTLRGTSEKIFHATLRELRVSQEDNLTTLWNDGQMVLLQIVFMTNKQVNSCISSTVNFKTLCSFISFVLTGIRSGHFGETYSNESEVLKVLDAYRSTPPHW